MGVLAKHDRCEGSTGLRGVTRGWTGGTGSTQAAVPVMARNWGQGITAPTWPRMPPSLWEGMERAAA